MNDPIKDEFNFSKCTFYVSVACLSIICIFATWAYYTITVQYEQIRKPVQDQAINYLLGVLPKEIQEMKQHEAAVDNVLHSILFDNKELRSVIEDRNSAQDEKITKLEANVDWISRFFKQGDTQIKIATRK